MIITKKVVARLKRLYTDDDGERETEEVGQFSCVHAPLVSSSVLLVRSTELQYEKPKMSADSKCFWLISAPKTPQDTFALVNRRTSKESPLATNYKFEVPDLKVGTMDSLVALSDDLAKLDLFVESTTRKIVVQLFDVVDKKPEKHESLTINGTTVETYLTHFAWEEAKYPIRSSLRELTDKIQGQVGKLEEELKVKTTDYNSISHTIAAEERKQGGSLLVRNLSELVKPADVLETDYLTTLLVCVPKSLYKEWQTNYETLTDLILPRSSKVIGEDNEFYLVTVTLFKRVAENFKNIARERRFAVRDFKLEADGQGSKEERNRLVTEKDRQRRNLIRWCKTNFAEAFVAWVHLKAIRVFVESVLRFGLPINFQAILMLPMKKEDRRLREALFGLFQHLGSAHVSGREEDPTGEKFYPYVYLAIDLTDM